MTPDRVAKLQARLDEASAETDRLRDAKADVAEHGSRRETIDAHTAMVSAAAYERESARALCFWSEMADEIDLVMSAAWHYSDKLHQQAAERGMDWDDEDCYERAVALLQIVGSPLLKKSIAEIDTDSICSFVDGGGCGYDG